MNHALRNHLSEARWRILTVARAFYYPLLFLFALLTCSSHTACAGVAYGSINNFDTVNDTSNVCHGFEIELDDIHTAETTSTNDYNHYGTPKIPEDTSDPLHPKVIVRYEAIWTNTGWSAYTAVPTTN